MNHCQLRRAGPTQRKRYGRQDPGEEIRQQTAVASDQEVDRVPREHAGGVAMEQDVERDRVRRHALTAVVERLDRIGERIAGSRVEGLAESPLVIGLPRRHDIDQDQRRDHETEDCPEDDNATKPALPDRKREKGQQEQQMGGLGERRDPQEGGGGKLRPV